MTDAGRARSARTSGLTNELVDDHRSGAGYFHADAGPPPRRTRPRALSPSATAPRRRACPRCCASLEFPPLGSEEPRGASIRRPVEAPLRNASSSRHGLRASLLSHGTRVGQLLPDASARARGRGPRRAARGRRRADRSRSTRGSSCACATRTATGSTCACTAAPEPLLEIRIALTNDEWSIRAPLEAAFTALPPGAAQRPLRDEDGGELGAPAEDGWSLRLEEDYGRRRAEFVAPRRRHQRADLRRPRLHVHPPDGHARATTTSSSSGTASARSSRSSRCGRASPSCPPITRTTPTRRPTAGAEPAQDARPGDSLRNAMAANIANERAERLVHEQRVQALTSIAERSAGRPVLDRRGVDEILGYDGNGLLSSRCDEQNPEPEPAA